MKLGRCDECFYYNIVSERGVCQRFPPTPIFDPQLSATDQYARARWPLVEADWGCGEYKNTNEATELPV